MVFRLFVPPGESPACSSTRRREANTASGEGQHKLVPKRPDAVGGNATLQYAVLGSTAAAAAYTSFATRYGHRTNPSYTLSQPALFIRSSAKLGLWAAVMGAAANWYYNSRFTSVVLSQGDNEVASWKLFERTKSLTVDDGCLVGAGLGLAASVPALFMRRLAIPRWTRCLGLANVGACAGMLGAHGYLQYTGDRKKAYARLSRRLQRRSLEFWALFWDKKTMAQLNPLVQLYVRHNALWYAQQLPDTAFEQSEDHDAISAGSRDLSPHADSPDVAYAYEDQSYYLPPFDYAEDLKYINVEATHAKIEEHEAEIAALLKEAEFILFVSARRQYEYCHLQNADDEERRQRLEELQLLQITYNKLRSAAEQLQSRLINWRMSLQHKAIMDSPAPTKTSIAAWLPPTSHDFTTHDPTLSLQELERTQAALDAEIKSFEASIAHPGYPRHRKERWRADLEDGRALLRGADRIAWEFEKLRDAARRGGVVKAGVGVDADVGAGTSARGQRDSTDADANAASATKREPGGLESGRS